MVSEYYLSLQWAVVIVLSEFRCVNFAVQQSIENSITRACSLPIEKYVQEVIQEVLEGFTTGDAE